MKGTAIENTFKVRQLGRNSMLIFQNPDKLQIRYLSRMPVHHGQHTMTWINGLMMQGKIKSGIVKEQEVRNPA